MKRLIFLVVAFLSFTQTAYSVTQYPLSQGFQQFFDANGVPLSGGFVYTCQPGTTCTAASHPSLKTTYSDSTGAGGSANANPIVLDSAGRANIWGTGFYKIAVYDAAGNLIKSNDNVPITFNYVTPATVPWVYADTYASLNAAITAIGSTPTTLLIRNAGFPLTGNAVVPSTLYLKFEYPGSLSHGAYNVVINSPFANGNTQVFTGTGSITGAGFTEARPEWFGGAIGADSGAAINKAIIAANGDGPVLLSGMYLSSVQIAANIPSTHLKGDINGFIYGPTASPIGIKFVNYSSTAVTSYTNPSDSHGQPYITLENITIDGNNVAKIGYEGGFIDELKNSTFINCTEAGVHTKNTQAFRIQGCGLNGNLDGYVQETAGGTVSFINNTFRQNTRYGVSISGVGGVISFTGSNILESNGDAGIYLNGGFENIYLGPGTYFEANDLVADVEPTRYHVKATLIPYQSNNEGIVFDNAYFAAVSPIKAAHIVSGKIKFRDCNLVGDTDDEPVTIDAGDVIFEDSFTSYAKISTAKIRPETVKIDPISPINMDVNASISVAARALSFGVNDFSVSAVLTPNESTATNRIITKGAASGFTMGMLGNPGSPVALTVIYFALTGSAVHHTTTVALRNNVPYHIVYVRASNIGYLYINGTLVESFADASNYSGNQSLIGDDTNGMVSKLYQLSYFDAALTAAQVLELWRNGGNALSALLSGDLTLNLMFDKRATTAVYDSVSATSLTITNSDWCNLSTP